MLKHIWPWRRFHHAQKMIDALLSDNARLTTELAAYKRFDHDGDNRPGGSKKRTPKAVKPDTCPPKVDWA